MRRLMFALLVVTLYPQVAIAITFSDSFSTNPFASPARWCERYHSVHWDSINLLVSGVNATQCGPHSNGLSCCPPDQACIEGFFCSTAPGNVHGLITTADYTGLTRSAQTVFAVQRNFRPGTGEHLAVFAITHPNCHVGYEATITPQSGGGYKLQIASMNDMLHGYPACSGIPPGAFSPASATFQLTPTTLPRYKLTLTIKPDADISAIIGADATLVDTQTNTTLATARGSFSKQGWYNNQAKRFLVGGVLVNNGFVIPHDNFVGTAQ